MPQPVKVAAIQRIATPRHRKVLRHFLGMVNYYRDVWLRRAHLVASLSALTLTKVSLVWLPEHQSAFDKITAIMERETLLHYPDYTKGFDVHNIVADALSRLPYTENTEELCVVLAEEYYPLSYERLPEAQQEDAKLQATVQKYPRKFVKKGLGNRTIIATQKQQLVIPSALQDTVLSFYHSVLLHSGMTRMYLTMAAAVYWPGMKRAVEQLMKSCSTCQLWNRSQKRYGKLPVKKRQQEAWTEIAVDQIGPYTCADEPDAPTFYALTMMDMATHWIEIAPLDYKTSVLTAKQLDEYWLCRYPRPLRVIHDEGPEFTGRDSRKC
ncbi:hypothetical protein ON010_g18951 [Phytophthora cinnamomi]|nr:hypothetical protein ON010_g18951 [Phytophthora cinnamomi]